MADKDQIFVEQRPGGFPGTGASFQGVLEIITSH